jgi:RHS repeat-associated protein
VSVLTDVAGSTVALTGAAGTIETTYAYEPFGAAEVDGLADIPFQYTGSENDGGGLYHHGARYYAPALHRLLSEDPLRERGSGSNLYAYARNDPLNLVDRLGLEPEKQQPCDGTADCADSSLNALGLGGCCGFTKEADCSGKTPGKNCDANQRACIAHDSCLAGTGHHFLSGTPGVRQCHADLCRDTLHPVLKALFCWLAVDSPLIIVDVFDGRIPFPGVFW